MSEPDTKHPETIPLHVRRLGVVSLIESEETVPDPLAEEAISEHQHLPEDDRVDITYYALLRNNRPFRLFLSSYLITHVGQWFTYVASITLIERLLSSSGREESRTYISILVVVRLVPNIVLSALGGALADSRDRRENMVALDVAGAAVALLYLVAFSSQSISMVYIAACFQESVTALYEPNRTAMVNLLVSSEAGLQKAVTIIAVAWSAMAAVGAAVGGFVVAWFGIQICFVVDSFTYLVSAFLIFLVKGKYNVADSEEKANDSICDRIRGMSVDGARYISSSFFGGIVFVKASAAILYGASDVLNVSFSERDGQQNASERLGAFFAAMGVGCIAGPLLCNTILGSKARPSYLQLACVWSIVVIAVSYLGIALFSPFGFTLFFTSMRSMGTASLWVNSTLILQTFSIDAMMGRVMAVDFALATLTEALSALLCGFLQDRADLTVESVCLVLSGLGVLVAIFWTVYYICGYGVANTMDAQEILQKEGTFEIEAVSLERHPDRHPGKEFDSGQSSTPSSFQVV